MTTQQPSKQERSITRPSPRLVLLLYGALAGVCLGMGYFLYKNKQIVRQAGRERSLLRAAIRNKQVMTDSRQLLLGMKTFSWAIRNALLLNKTGVIADYFNALGKDNCVQEVLLINPSGKVVFSSNKKHQGILFVSCFPGYLLQQPEAYFNDKDIYELSAPVMGPTKRIGTLVMFYKPASLPLNSVSQ